MYDNPTIIERPSPSFTYQWLQTHPLSLFAEGPAVQGGRGGRTNTSHSDTLLQPGGRLVGWERLDGQRIIKISEKFFVNTNPSTGTLSSPRKNLNLKTNIYREYCILVYYNTLMMRPLL